MGNLFADFKTNQRGNVATMFGLVILVLMGLLALTLDFSRAQNLKASLTDIADSAALAGANLAVTGGENRGDIIRDLVDIHVATSDLNNADSSITLTSSSVDFDHENAQLTVTLNGQVKTSFAGIFGFSALNVSGQSTTAFGLEDISPVSMAFILDHSGSMTKPSSSGGTKIEALQSSVETMFNVIEEAAPRQELLQTNLRTGMTAFDDELVTEHTIPMGFGWTTVEHEVFKLTPKGDTNTTPAFDLAFQMLAGDTPNETDVRKFLIFMTDGRNDNQAENGNTLLLCDQAKAQGIEIFSIAFEAPQKGQDLLRACASGINTANNAGEDQGSIPPASPVAGTQAQQYYFDAQDGDELVAAFRQIGREIGRFDLRIVR